MIARFPLDFLARQSVCVPDNTDRADMDRSATDIVIQLFLMAIRNRLDEAAGIARAADACASAGNLQKAIEVALDIEQIAYEVNRLLDAASLLQRIKQQE
ncbi:MAG: hypothetical protein AB7O43_20640 [Hyphomicrobiaceae bacterium]